jgi:hypothetical protein
MVDSVPPLHQLNRFSAIPKNDRLMTRLRTVTTLAPWLTQQYEKPQRLST